MNLKMPQPLERNMKPQNTEIYVLALMNKSQRLNLLNVASSKCQDFLHLYIDDMVEF